MTEKYVSTNCPLPDTIAKTELLESIVTLAIYCSEHPDDEEAKKTLSGELRGYQDCYGEMGFESLKGWQEHWRYARV